MQHTIQHNHAHQLNIPRKSVLTTFIKWSTKQEPKRLSWLATILVTQACIMVPVTLFVLSHTEMDFIFWVMPVIAIVMCLVTNLAALPTKITIPVFFISIAIDLFVLVSCLS